MDLRKLQEDIERYRALCRRWDALERQRKTLEEREAALTKIRAKEDADVEKWEGGSLAAFFYGVVGRKEERLEKEKQEAHEAAVQHDAVRAELAAVLAEQKRVTEEQKRLAGCEEAYERAIAEKAAALAAVGRENGLPELERMQAQYRERRREIRAALDAGEKAAERLRQVQKILADARSWGNADIFGGKGVSTMMKQERLRQAQRGIEEMQVDLRRFERELTDVDLQADIQIELTGFLGVADYLFDSFFVDIQVQERILDAQKKVENLESQIQAACARLKQMERSLTEKEQQCKEDWQKRIAEA